MRKIYYTLDIGYAGCQDEGTTEVPDSMTDEEIYTMVYDMAIEWAQSWEGDQRLGWDDDMSEEEQQEYTDSFYENVDGYWHFVENDDEADNG